MYGMDVRIKFDDSWSNRSRDIGVAHLVMDDRQTTPADVGHHIRQKRHWAFCLKILAEQNMLTRGSTLYFAYKFSSVELFVQRGNNLGGEISQI